MNTTVKRFPRTLAEAFPNSLEASQARAEYGCAITRYRREFIHTRMIGPALALFFVGFLLGVLVTK